MAKKRKSDATRLDEVDRNMYSTFRSAANHLSQLYTQAMNQQKLAFQAGERHAMEKLYQWILRQHEEGSRVPAADIIAYLQNELDYGGEDASVPPRLSSQHHQHSQPAAHMLSSGTQTSSMLFGQSTVGHAPRNGIPDESKNSVFSNALSSPIRRSLQPYHLAQGGEYYQNNALPTGNGARNNEAFSRDTNPVNSNDSSMDMHSDSSAHESY